MKIISVIGLLFGLTLLNGVAVAQEVWFVTIVNKAQHYQQSTGTKVTIPLNYTISKYRPNGYLPFLTFKGVLDVNRPTLPIECSSVLRTEVVIFDLKNYDGLHIDHYYKLVCGPPHYTTFINNAENNKAPPHGTGRWDFTKSGESYTLKIKPLIGGAGY